MLSETTRALLVEVVHHGNLRDVTAFIKNAKTRCAKEIAMHLGSRVRLAARYDRLPDDHEDIESVVDAMGVHEDWLGARLLRA
jgi:hypothetical protein